MDQIRIFLLHQQHFLKWANLSQVASTSTIEAYHKPRSHELRKASFIPQSHVWCSWTPSHSPHRSGPSQPLWLYIKRTQGKIRSGRTLGVVQVVHVLHQNQHMSGFSYSFRAWELWSLWALEYIYMGVPMCAPPFLKSYRPPWIRYANGWRLQLCLPPVGKVLIIIIGVTFLDDTILMAHDNNANIGITVTIYIS